MTNIKFFQFPIKIIVAKINVRKIWTRKNSFREMRKRWNNFEPRFPHKNGFASRLLQKLKERRKYLRASSV
jgi:hypothetical protein